MADKTSLAAYTALDPDRAALDELARALEGLAGGRGGPAAPDEGEAEIELRMADLVSDHNGEVVFFNDSGARTVGITSDVPVVADGRADPHVTASGADVTGYRFVTFENGPTLYFEDGLDLIVHGPVGAIT